MLPPQPAAAPLCGGGPGRAGAHSRGLQCAKQAGWFLMGFLRTQEAPADCRQPGGGAAKKYPASLGHAGHRRPARAAQRGQALDFSWILGPPSEEILRQNCAQTHSSPTNTTKAKTPTDSEAREAADEEEADEEPQVETCGQM